MKLAMIYALPNSRLHDSARAQTLLDELLREKLQDSELKTLAILLRDHINENNKLIQKAREEQKRADSAQQKSDASQQKISDLERKLQDLKNIEKAMVDRDSGTRK
jgi:predicted ribosome quality control (RQC) complex YloA/Tae2 family protein